MNHKATGGATPDPPAFQLLNEVGIIDQLAQHRAAQLLAPELNMPQFIVLNHLVRRGSDATQIELAYAMHGRCAVGAGSRDHAHGAAQAAGLLGWPTLMGSFETSSRRAE